MLQRMHKKALRCFENKLIFIQQCISGTSSSLKLGTHWAILHVCTDPSDFDRCDKNKKSPHVGTLDRPAASLHELWLILIATIWQGRYQ